jgi:hypothetical protein
MMSAYMSEFVSYNVLDSDYLASKPKCVKMIEEDKDEDNEDNDEIQLEEIIPITNNDN